ncbi:MAG: TetR/AcrR family transcriptional regulator [Kofleriaceae bacterium]|nr:TetR/AcrR family transcriptional regulator [Kofleriaceae bacterium]
MEEQKRQNILDAAVRSFSTLGFKKTSIADIARDAGVAKGTVYLACDSKQDLFYQVVMQDLRKWIATVATSIDPRAPADETLMALARNTLEFFDSFPLVRDLFVGIFHGEHPGWADKFDALRTLGRANVAELLRLGIRQGRFRSDLDVEITAELLQDYQHTTLILGYHGAVKVEDMQKRLELGFDLLFNGLRAGAEVPE